MSAAWGFLENLLRLSHTAGLLVPCPCCAQPRLHCSLLADSHGFQSVAQTESCLPLSWLVGAQKGASELWLERYQACGGALAASLRVQVAAHGSAHLLLFLSVSSEGAPDRGRHSRLNSSLELHFRQAAEDCPAAALQEVASEWMPPLLGNYRLPGPPKQRWDPVVLQGVDGALRSSCESSVFKCRMG